MFLVPPFWLEEPRREQNVVSGNSAELHCHAEGFPKPTITWKVATGMYYNFPKAY